FAGKKSAQIREILISESAWEEMTCLFAPSLGTKPTAIGICVFLINNHPNNSVEKQLGAIYDYPIKSINRTIGIGEIYSYELSIS
ncbi:hypothetical protein L1Q87_24425, partial [Klebsiella pneumoniae]